MRLTSLFLVLDGMVSGMGGRKGVRLHNGLESLSHDEPNEFLDILRGLVLRVSIRIDVHRRDIDREDLPDVRGRGEFHGKLSRSPDLLPEPLTQLPDPGDAFPTEEDPAALGWAMDDHDRNVLGALSDLLAVTSEDDLGIRNGAKLGLKGGPKLHRLTCQRLPFLLDHIVLLN